jgi:predicted nuclease with TOPRIM domain
MEHPMTTKLEGERPMTETRRENYERHRGEPPKTETEKEYLRQSVTELRGKYIETENRLDAMRELCWRHTELHGIAARLDDLADQLEQIELPYAGDV